MNACGPSPRRDLAQGGCGADCPAVRTVAVIFYRNMGAVQGKMIRTMRQGPLDHIYWSAAAERHYWKSMVKQVLVTS